MNKITKNLAVFGLAMSMLLPLSALAMAPVAVDGGAPVQLAAGDLSDITSNLDTVAEESGIGGEGDDGDLPKMIGAIINSLLGLLGIVLVVLVIWAGFKWMMSKGDAKEVTEAKGMMVNAVIGITSSWPPTPSPTSSLRASSASRPSRNQRKKPDRRFCQAFV